MKILINCFPLLNNHRTVRTLTLYPVSNLPLPEGPAGTDCGPWETRNFLITFPTLNVASHSGFSPIFISFSFSASSLRICRNVPF